MTEDLDSDDKLPDHLAARLWAIEHVMEAVIIWYWRDRAREHPDDWLKFAKDHVEGGSLAAVMWAVDHGLEPGDDPEMEALVAKHVRRQFEHAYLRLERGLRRIADDPPDVPPAGSG